MQLTPEDLQQITGRTLAHYNERARDFWEGTRAHDVRQNVEALLQHIESAPPSSCSTSAAVPDAT